MKYDLSKPITRGAKRTLDALSGAMFLLLSEKSFEEITVGELCEQAQYPRATFYNYFDDKYDLLNYCWLSLAEKIRLSEYHHAPKNEMLYLFFDRIYAFTKQNNELISQMRRIFRECPDALHKDIPNELLADHYSNTLFLVWQWSTVKDSTCDKDQAIKYLQRLLSIQ